MRCASIRNFYFPFRKRFQGQWKKSIKKNYDHLLINGNLNRKWIGSSFRTNMKRNGNHKHDDYSQRTNQPNRKQNHHWKMKNCFWITRDSRILKSSCDFCCWIFTFAFSIFDMHSEPADWDEFNCGLAELYYITLQWKKNDRCNWCWIS